jgi:hypothetical protein
MNTEDLRRLAERAEGVEGRQADRLSEVHGRIRTARHRRTAVGAAAAAGVAIALVAGGAALTGSTDNTQEPVDQNTPRPAPTETVEAPAGQVTLRPEIGPGDIRGWELRASRTNTQPGFTGATDLSLTVETGGLLAFQSHIVTFCNGDPDTWWVLTMDLGGVEGGRNPDGSMQDGTRALFSSCAQDDPTEVPGPTGNIEPPTRDYREVARTYPMRMFVTGALSQAAQQCLSRTADTDACLATHGLAPLADSDAVFGFGVYEHKAAPVVLAGPGIRSQALAMADGVEYLVDRAVVSAPDAPRLVVPLPASDRPRIVAVFASETAALEVCAARLGNDIPSSPEEEQAQVEEFDRRCATELKLRIDGRRVPYQEHEFYFGEQQVVLPPGDAREVTVEVVRNDPRNVRFALAIWEAR